MCALSRRGPDGPRVLRRHAARRTNGFGIARCVNPEQRSAGRRKTMTDKPAAPLAPSSDELLRVVIESTTHFAIFSTDKPIGTALMVKALGAHMEHRRNGAAKTQ